MQHITASDEGHPAPPAEMPMPLYVDLDGTLVRTDVAQEQLISAIKEGGAVSLLRAAMSDGRSGVKRAASDAAQLHPELLPYNEEVLSYLRSAKKDGRRIVLATAADRPVAEAVADHLGLFDAILASEPGRNLKGEAKLEAITADCDDAPFEYLGDSPADIILWDNAAACGYVNPWGKAAEAAIPGDATLFVENKPPVARGLLKAMRTHQWFKNILVFIPVFFAHAYSDLPTLGLALIAFLSLSLLASGTYLLNDLFDIAADRAHPSKRKRPFAAGTVSPVKGVGAGFGLIFGALILSFAVVGPAFGATMVTYLLITSVYTLHLKRFSTVDVVALGLLFTIRIVAGGVATGIPVSPWLLAFALFFFTSLAYMKRYIELLRVAGDDKLPSRNYWGSEVPIVLAFGVSTSALSLLTLAQYVMSDQVRAAYSGADLLWLVLPLMLFWSNRNWTWASRGKMDDDPVLFAMKDGISRATLLMIILLFVAAKYTNFEVYGL
jgi:4-hydroxybenzoate polyprenyltransferase